MRLSEIELDTDTIDNFQCWGIEPMKVLLSYLDSECDFIEGDSNTVLYTKYMLENFLLDIEEFLTRYQMEYVRKLEKLYIKDASLKPVEIAKRERNSLK